MSVNYKLIADNDPGGELETAFSLMENVTAETTPEVMLTYRRISAGVSLEASAALELAVNAAPAIPSWVDKALSTDGVDVNNTQTVGLLAALVPDHATAIQAMGTVVVPKYGSGFRVGHLQNARQMREEGSI
jgi:hypothetical protein